MTALKGKGKAAVKIGMQYGKVVTDSDFASLRNENEKLVSGLLPVQFVSPQFVCFVVLQHEGEWMSFLTQLLSRFTGGVWRLDGVWGKKQVWHPHFRT